MLTLTIDRGNTHSKCVLFSENGDVLNLFPLDKIQHFIHEYSLTANNTRCLYVSVKEVNLDIPLPAVNVKTFFHNHQFLNMPIHYNESVGLDRLVVAFYCYQINHFNKIVIDTGTFTTVDHIDLKGFNGGFILPGLKILTQIYNSGAQLQEASEKAPENLSELSRRFPQKTSDAIHHGAFLSYLAPIAEVIRQNKVKNIIITGGNGKILYDYLKNQSFCQSASIQLIPNLIHTGLREISQRVQK